MKALRTLTKLVENGANRIICFVRLFPTHRCKSKARCVAYVYVMKVVDLINLKMSISIACRELSSGLYHALNMRQDEAKSCFLQVFNYLDVSL